MPRMGSFNFICGNYPLRKHVQQQLQLKCPEAIKSTKLRKHIVTLSQLLNLEERELEMLATFMGHDITVHWDFYRLPEDNVQLAICGKLLVLMDQGKMDQFAGKKLSEIDINVSYV